jgi:hypothetical protein
VCHYGTILCQVKESCANVAQGRSGPDVRLGTRVMFAVGAGTVAWEVVRDKDNSVVTWRMLRLHGPAFVNLTRA